MDKISSEELLTLKLLKSELDKSSIKLEADRLNFRYFLLSMYRKYNLSDQDNISDVSGEIIKEEAKSGQ